MVGSRLLNHLRGLFFFLDLPPDHFSDEIQLVLQSIKHVLDKIQKDLKNSWEMQACYIT